MKATLHAVCDQSPRVLLTRHGKPIGAIIPMQDVPVPWQSQQDRPVEEMAYMLKKNRARWLEDTRVPVEGRVWTELDERRRVPFWCFEQF